MPRRIVSIVSLILISLIATCCAGGSPEATEGSADYPDPWAIEPTLTEEVRTQLEDDEIDDDMRAIVEGSPPMDLAPSAYDLIDASLDAGEIDRGTHALLILQAAYAPDALPETYEGPRYLGGKVTLRREIQWLINHREELDEDERKIALPFILPAKDPGSFLHPDFDDEENRLRDLWGSSTAYAQAGWKDHLLAVPGAPKEVRIFYRDAGLSDAKRSEIAGQIEHIETALAAAWPRFKALLGVQPKREIEVYLTNRLAADTDGEAVYYPGNGGIHAYEIHLTERIDGDSLRSTTVHELFHVFQYEMGLTWFDVSSQLDWLTEATAVWSEDYMQGELYPDHNKEHQYLTEFFAHLRSDRLSCRGTREYGSYLLFRYLTGDCGCDMGDILRAAAGRESSMDIRGMLMDHIGYEDLREVYGEFAFYNWNQDPYRNYTDQPSFPPPPKPARPFHDSMKIHFLEGTGEWDFSADMQEGGIIYQVFVLKSSPEDVPWIRFDFEDTPPTVDDAPVVARQALVKIGDEWTREDWTELEYREFCRKKDEENITGVVLISSNGHLLWGASHDFTITTDGDCPVKGYTRISWELIGSADGVSAEERYELHSQDSMEYCPVSECFVLTERQVTFESHAHTEMPNPFHMEGVPKVGPDLVERTVTGEGSLYETYSLEDECRRMEFEDEDEASIYLFPDPKTEGWITYTESGHAGEEVKKRDRPTGMPRGSIEFRHGNRSYTGPAGEKVTEDCVIEGAEMRGVITMETTEPLGTGRFTVEFEYGS
ncbi:MAG: hypothetical protein ACLFS8_00170 [Clostridia bacterium]